MTDKIVDIDMKYTVTQVGRRWFKVKAEVSTFSNDIESIAVVVDVEATLKRVTWWNDDEWALENGMRFSLVGKGARKYRQGILEALENFLAPKEMPF